MVVRINPPGLGDDVKQDVKANTDQSGNARRQHYFSFPDHGCSNPRAVYGHGNLPK
jgi:hypothetical protein